MVDGFMVRTGSCIGARSPVAAGAIIADDAWKRGMTVEWLMGGKRGRGGNWLAWPVAYWGGIRRLDWLGHGTR
jgi:hypothetical protein